MAVEQLPPSPSPFPLGRVSHQQIFDTFMPKSGHIGEKQRIQSVLNEEMSLIMGGDKAVPAYVTIMSAHLNIPDGPNIPSLRVGMIAMHRATRLKCESIETQLSVTNDQLHEYLDQRGLVIKTGPAGQYAAAVNHYPWDKMVAEFNEAEKDASEIIASKNLGSENFGISFVFGYQMMWDFLKTTRSLPR